MATSTDQNRLEGILLGQQVLVDEVHLWLAEEQKRDDIVRAVVRGSRGERIAPLRDIDPKRVFGLSDIKSICVRYRLRFLDAGLFKGELPPQAVLAVRTLERECGEPLRGFKVMAPAARFRLCDCEADPLLFVPLGGDRYYLLHKWGRDIKWHRALAGWPFRSPVHLGAAVLLLAVLLTALVPTALVTTDPQAGFWGAHRLLLFFWSASVLASFTVFAWFAFFGQFSDRAWDSRYFN